MLRLTTFGGLALERDGQPVGDIANRKVPLALLAVLAGHAERGIARDRVVAYLWPDSDEERGRNSLKQATFGLRRTLGDHWIAASGSTLRLNPALISADIIDFQAALQVGAALAAVRLYRGPFLDGFYLDDRPELERWVDEERQRLTNSYLDTLTRLAERAEAAGDTTAAISWWRRSAAAAPLDTKSSLRLIRTLAAGGDIAAALEHGRLYASVLRAELDIDPDPSVTALLERLRRPPPSGTAATWLPIRDRVSPTGSLVPALAAPAAPVARSVPVIRRRPVASAWLAYLLPLVAAILLAWLGNGVLNRNLKPEPAGARIRLAVLPFATLGEGPDSGLARGLDALVAAGLDGFEDYRVVPLNDGRRGDSDRAPATTAAASSRARRAGARMFVTGRLIVGRDRVRAVASLRDRANADQEVGRVEVEGDRGELFTLADDLIRGLVTERHRGPGERLARSASAGTRSLPALRAYLEGDRKQRVDDLQGAVDAFGRAVRADTAFALAYFSLSLAADRAGWDETAMWAAGVAAHFNERLSEHDRRLVTAYLMAKRGLLDEAERGYRSILADYPEDAEAWLQLGELLMHGNPLRGRSAREARIPFERVLALDSTQGNALVHLARILALDGERPRADSLLARAAQLLPSLGALDLRAVRSFALNDRPGRERATRDLLAQPSLVPQRLPLEVAVHLDDLAGTARFAGILTVAPGTCDVRALGHRMLAQVAMARGQLRNARHQLALAAPCDPGAALELRAVLATHPLVPPGSELGAVRLALDSTPGTGTDSLVRRYYAALAGLDLGDTTAAKRAVRTLGAAREPGSDVALAGTLAHSLAARLALGRARPADALAELEAAGWERTARLTIAEAADRFLRAELLRMLGREQEAAGWYASIAERASYELIYLAPAEWRLGQMAEAAGDRATAARHYRRFAELWKDADPELRSAVEDDRRRF